MKRGLVAIVAVLLFANCGGDSGQPAAPAPSPTSAAATPTQEPASPPATATSPAATLAPSPTAIPSPTPTERPEPSATPTAALATPVVIGSPATGLPVAGAIEVAVPVGTRPAVIAVGHGAIWAQNDFDGTLSRIDPSTNEVVATIQITTPVDASNPPSDLLGVRQASPGLAVDADSVWATAPEEQSVVQVDPQTNAVIRSIPMASGVTSIAVNGSSLWVSLYGASSVVRVDTETGEIVATIPDVPTPAGIAAHGDAVWVANYLSDTVTRIDPATNQVVARISVSWTGAPATGFQCSLCATEVLADEQGVWVSLLSAGVIARIDAGTNRLAAIIPVGTQPASLASDALGLWVGHKGSAGVLLIDPATNQVVGAVPATEAPYQLPAIALAENTVWVARAPSNDVVRIALQPD